MTLVTGSQIGPPSPYSLPHIPPSLHGQQDAPTVTAGNNYNPWKTPSPDTQAARQRPWEWEDHRPKEQFPKTIGDYTIDKDPAYNHMQVITYKDGKIIGRTTKSTDWNITIDAHKRELEARKVDAISKSEYEKIEVNAKNKRTT